MTEYPERRRWFGGLTRSRRVSAGAERTRVFGQEFVLHCLRSALAFGFAFRAALCFISFTSFAAFAQEPPAPSPPPPPPHVEPIPNEIPPPPDGPPPMPPRDGPPAQDVQPGAEQPIPPPPDGPSGEPPPPVRRRERTREYGRQPEDPPTLDWRTPRKGFHFALGAGGMVYPGQSANGRGIDAVGYVAILPAVSYSFGWLEAHVAVQGLGYLTQEQKALFIAADAQLRINFARWYSLGFGPYLGFVAAPKLEGVAGVSISPLIFKLGDRGQHELSLWSATPFLFTNNRSGISLLLISYSFVFF